MPVVQVKHGNAAPFRVYGRCGQGAICSYFDDQTHGSGSIYRSTHQRKLGANAAENWGIDRNLMVPYRCRTPGSQMLPGHHILIIESQSKES